MIEVRRSKDIRELLLGAKGFVSEEPPQESDPDADRFYFEAMEREADRRAAFGLYAAYVRQTNLEEALAEIEKAEGSDVENRKQQYIKSIETGGLYIG